MRLCALLLACMAVSPAFAYEIYANAPNAGEDLQVLADGAGNATVKMISPQGQEFFVRLKNGQGRLRAETAGMWLVEFEGQRKAVMVSEREFEGGKAEAGADLAQLAAFSFVLISILVSIAFAAWKNFYKKNEARAQEAKARPDAPKAAKRKLERA